MYGFEKSGPPPAGETPDPRQRPQAQDPALPAHTVRKSKRAKRILLRALPGKGLEVVLPPGADPARVPEVLKRHGAWIDRALARLGGTGRGQEEEIPRLLSLRGGLEEVEILLPDMPDREEPFPQEGPGRARGNGYGSDGSGSRRVLSLPGVEPAAVRLRLREWLREEARAVLCARLDEIARRHAFSYASLSLRFQKTRWGSCSAKGGINLNAALLFLPDPLINYIAAHELCHTRQMDHSPAFWKLLFAVDPDALARDRAMRRAWRYVPGWIFNTRPDHG